MRQLLRNSGRVSTFWIGPLLIIGAMLTLFFFWLTSTAISPLQQILAIFIGMLSMTPMALHFLRQDTITVPLFSINCAFYFIAFGISGLHPASGSNADTFFTPEGMVPGLIVGSLALSCQIFGYYLARSTMGIGRPIMLFNSLNTQQLRLLGWTNIILSCVGIAAPVIRSLPTLGQLIYICPYLGIGTLYLLHCRNRISSTESTLLFAVLIPLELTVRLLTGAVFLPVLLMIFLAIIQWHIRRNINLWYPLIGILVYLAGQPVKHIYREQTWYSQTDKQMSTIEKAEFFVDLTADYWLNSSSSDDKLQVTILSRFNHLTLLAVCIEATPNIVPYWDGETLKLGLSAMIPRVLWPDKPNLEVGNSFGKRYYFIDYSNQTTTVNLTWVTELYINFGYPAVVIGMTLIGIIFCVLEKLCTHPRNTDAGTILPLCVVFQLVYPESNIMLMWGGLVTSLIAVYLMVLVFQVGSKTEGP